MTIIVTKEQVERAIKIEQQKVKVPSFTVDPSVITDTVDFLNTISEKLEPSFNPDERALLLGLEELTDAKPILTDEEINMLKKYKLSDIKTMYLADPILRITFKDNQSIGLSGRASTKGEMRGKLLVTLINAEPNKELSLFNFLINTIHSPENNYFMKLKIDHIVMNLPGAQPQIISDAFIIIRKGLFKQYQDQSRPFYQRLGSALYNFFIAPVVKFCAWIGSFFKTTAPANIPAAAVPSANGAGSNPGPGISDSSEDNLSPSVTPEPEPPQTPTQSIGSDQDNGPSSPTARST